MKISTAALCEQRDNIHYISMDQIYSPYNPMLIKAGSLKFFKETVSLNFFSLK